MFKLLLRVFVITLGLIGPAMAQERILISSDWGKVSAELVDNNATRSLVQMLPLTIEMRDHLRQEKTANMPSPLPASIVWVIYGVLLIVAPKLGALVLTWWIGAYALVFGISLVVLAFKLRSRHETGPRATLPAST